MLLEAVICEAKVCGTGQPVTITGDLIVEPLVVPVTAKALHCGHLIDLEEAYSRVRGEAPTPTCRFDLDGAPGLRWLTSLTGATAWILLTLLYPRSCSAL